VLILLCSCYAVAESIALTVIKCPKKKKKKTAEEKLPVVDNFTSAGS
jgi:hypothetical protein